MRTGPSQSAVSNLGLKPRKNRESPNTPGSVIAKAITPLPQRVNILIPSELKLFTKYSY